MITSNSAMRTARSSIAARLSQHFHIVERRSSVRTEVVGGITTFAVMAYIIFLNPFVLTLNGSGREEHVASFAGLATAIGGLFGVSALTTYVESAAGVAAGARTGLAAMVAGLCFLVALGVTPFVGLIPPEATAPALIIVALPQARGTVSK